MNRDRVKRCHTMQSATSARNRMQSSQRSCVACQRMPSSSLRRKRRTLSLFAFPATGRTAATFRRGRAATPAAGPRVSRSGSRASSSRAFQSGVLRTSDRKRLPTWSRCSAHVVSRTKPSRRASASQSRHCTSTIGLSCCMVARSTRCSGCRALLKRRAKGRLMRSSSRLSASSAGSSTRA